MRYQLLVRCRRAWTIAGTFSSRREAANEARRLNLPHWRWVIEQQAEADPQQRKEVAA